MVAPCPPPLTSGRESRRPSVPPLSRRRSRQAAARRLRPQPGSRRRRPRPDRNPKRIACASTGRRSSRSIACRAPSVERPRARPARSTPLEPAKDLRRRRIPTLILIRSNVARRQAMEVRILGPLEVRAAGGTVALGGIKPRALLAMLALHANTPVSLERLTVALWGDEAPPGAVKALQVNVSRLRKALGDTGVLQTTPAGYKLVVGPDELDAERFERELAAGREALAARDVEAAAGVLRGAPVRWRGPALGGLEFEPFAPAEIARLEDQRLEA